MIKVYSKPACAQCNATYLALDKAGVTYEVFDVTKDENAMNRVIELGFFQAPVVEAGERSWSGFRPDLIQKVAAEVPILSTPQNTFVNA
ncbi:MAG: glutaredoxin-like protein NrdH [Bifidobacteriaceae bacterium]|jgi:glutaredoxin-like protein NrdH|nr:glutaredoxin-like protein NrdH [Bifidobacteriaceae bacterium]